MLGLSTTCLQLRRNQFARGWALELKETVILTSETQTVTGGPLCERQDSSMGPPRGTSGEVPSYAGPGMCGEGRRKTAEI